MEALPHLLVGTRSSCWLLNATGDHVLQDHVLQCWKVVYTAEAWYWSSCLHCRSWVLEKLHALQKPDAGETVLCRSLLRWAHNNQEEKALLFHCLQHLLLTKLDIASAAKGKRFKGPSSISKEQAMNDLFGAKRAITECYSTLIVRGSLTGWLRVWTLKSDFLGSSLSSAFYY